MMFNSRQHAGQLLVQVLNKRSIQPDVVFGLTRGGVVVAAEIAKVFKIPLKAIVAKKIGAPDNPEFAVGAMADSVVWWNKELVSQLGLSGSWQQRQVLEKEREIKEAAIRSDLEYSRSDLTDVRRIILADDGAATGATMMAALSAAKTPLSGAAARVIVALPVASSDAAEKIKRFADETLILEVDTYLNSVGQHYRQFEQVGWEEVRILLQSN